MLVDDWRIHEGFEDNIHRLTTGPRTGKILTAAAPRAECWLARSVGRLSLRQGNDR